MTMQERNVDFDLESFRKSATPIPAPEFVGAWSTVDIQPDVFAPQKFTVGVVVQSLGERLYFKLLNDFKKFECLYQDRFPAQSLQHIFKHAEKTLRHAAQAKIAIPDVVFETTSLMLSPPQFTSGDDKEVTVDRLFSEVVVMAPSAKKHVNEFVPISKSSARNLVNQELIGIAKNNFTNIIRESRRAIVTGVAGTQRKLDLNIVTPGACGSVESAGFKSHKTVELHLLRASTDIQAYARMKGNMKTGLFLLLPNKSILSAIEYKNINEVIGDHEWKLEQEGFRVCSSESPASLAKDIYDWAEPTLG